MNKNIPLVVILSCKNNVEQQKIITEHLKNKIEFIFVIGENKEDKLEDNILKLNVDDSYEYLHIKVVKAFDFIYKKIKRNIVKIDDDSFINLKNFKNYNFDFDYGGFINYGKTVNYTYHQSKIKDKRFFSPLTDKKEYEFALGGGYFLSKKALKVFLNNYKNNSEYFNHLTFKKGREDRIIGQTLTPFFTKLDIKNDGAWINRDNLLYFVFNNSIFHSISIDKYIKLREKNNPEFYV